MVRYHDINQNKHDHQCTEILFYDKNEILSGITVDSMHDKNMADKILQRDIIKSIDQCNQAKPSDQIEHNFCENLDNKNMLPRKSSEVENKDSHKFNLNYCSRNNCNCATSEYVKYIDLSSEEQYWLALYCVRKLKKIKQKKNFVLQMYDQVEKWFVDENMSYFQNDFTNQSIFDLLDHLDKHGPICPGLFRLSGKPSVYEELLKKMREEQKINYKNYSMRDICSLFKLFIRLELNGVLSPPIASMLYYFYGRNHKNELCEIQKYLPFIFLGYRRKLILRILSLYRKVDNNSRITGMTLKNMIVCSVLSLFPPKKASISTPVEHIRIFEDLFDVQFKYVHVDLLHASKKLRQRSTLTTEDEKNYGYECVNSSEMEWY